MRVSGRLLFITIVCYAIYSFSGEIILINNDVMLVNSSQHNPKFENTNYRSVLSAFIKSCNRILLTDESAGIFPQFGKNITVSDMIDTCGIAYRILNKNEKYIEFFFKNYFTPYLVVDNNTKKYHGIFTGYYLPKIKVKKNMDHIFKYPIYKKPKDIVDNKPYFTRKEINDGVLKNKNLELFYTNDMIDLFFLQIQGSGFAEDVDTGKLIKIGFDTKNNQKYSSIGKILSEKKLIDKDKLNSIDIKNFLKENPDIATDLMNLNKSYVFFKIIDDDKIVGSHGAELTNNVSLAVDTKYIPLGLPILLNTYITSKNNVKKSFNRIMISQDSGSAIKGIIRGDIFFGDSKYAEQLASYQYSKGQYFILIPKNIEIKMIQNNYGY